jgi:hypothetical protein
MTHQELINEILFQPFLCPKCFALARKQVWSPVLRMYATRDEKIRKINSLLSENNLGPLDQISN